MEQQAISSDLIRGHIDTIILHTLINGDKFAQQISDSIEQKSDNVYKINQATLYSSLKRLESLKHVESYWQDSDVGGRRKFFKLTDAGRKSVDDNLSNWSFSRAIIDKLMDCSPQPIVKTEFIERVVEVPVERTVIKEVEVPLTIAKNEVKADEPILKTESNQDVQEINFRNILNGLIQASNVNRTEHVKTSTEIQPLIKTKEKEEELVQKQKFNETINNSEYNAQKHHVGAIDFSDLTLKAAEEGYKLRISSKNSTNKSGNLLINKLNLLSALSIFLILMAELLIFSASFKNVLNPNPILIFVLIAIFAIIPIYALFKYKQNPILTSTKRITADIILTSAIIVFNLLLINFAGALLFGLDFSVEKDLLTYLIIPIILYLDILVYSIIRFYFARSKYCQIKHTK